MTPGFLAGIDQELARTDEILDGLVDVFRKQTAETGETACLATMASAFALIPPSVLGSLLMCALRRLARQVDPGAEVTR